MVFSQWEDKCKAVLLCHISGIKILKISTLVFFETARDAHGLRTSQIVRRLIHRHGILCEFQTEEEDRKRRTEEDRKACFPRKLYVPALIREMQLCAMCS